MGLHGMPDDATHKLLQDLPMHRAATHTGDELRPHSCHVGSGCL